MGDLLELRALGSLQLASRENITQTYLELSAKVAGVRQEVSAERVISQGPAAIGFTNFCCRLSFQGEEEREKGLKELADLNPVTSLFILEGDDPELTEDFLFSQGWMIKYELVQMVWEGMSPASDLEVHEAQTPQERIQTSLFMTDQFFPSGGLELRQAIISATSQAAVHLFSTSQGYEMQGAVMLVPTSGCLGLYNLCVEKRKRGKGLGRRILAWAQSQASLKGVPLVLQCGPDLVRYYKGCGLTSFGKMQCWTPFPPDFPNGPMS